ncbi:MAG: plastocyanin/azurin family copper-binding protein [Anaerolineae bacterium]
MKTYFYVLSMLLMAFFLIGCGSEAVEEAKPEPVSFNIEANDVLTFSVSELSFQSGANVTVNVNNTGALDHNWLLVSADKDPLTVTEVDALYGIKTETIGAGQSATVEFVAPGPGEYQFVCSTSGHAAAGMFGRVIVTE